MENHQRGAGLVTARRPWSASGPLAADSSGVRVVRESRGATDVQSLMGTAQDANKLARVFREKNGVNHTAKPIKETSAKGHGRGGVTVRQSTGGIPANPNTMSRPARPKTAGLHAAMTSSLGSNNRPNTAQSSQVDTSRKLPPPKHGLPSAKMRQSCNNPFAKSNSTRTPFGAAYAAGSIPCRIYHGSVKHSLTWSTPPELMPTFDPLLVNCAEGLREAQYPQHFVACQAFKELVQSHGAREKVVPLLSRIVPAVRKALLEGSAAGGVGVMKGALEAVRDLAWAAGPNLTPHMNPILIQVSKKMFDRNLKGNVTETLQALEEAGGEGMLALIKAKVPSYSPLLT